MATVRKRGKSYQIRASAGYGANGRQIVKAITWAPADGMTVKQIEKELNRVVVDFERRVESGQCIDSHIRFAEYAALWLARGAEDGEKPLAPKTYDRYKALLVRINAALGNIRLCDLQPHHIREFLDNLKEEGIRSDATYTASANLPALLKERHLTRQGLADAAGIGINTAYMACRGKNVSRNTAEALCKTLDLKLAEAFKENAVEGGKLSDKTVLHYFRLISTILNSAVVDDQALLANPAKRVRPPHVERTEALYLDEVQAAHMIELLEKEPIQYRTMILLLLYSGMRRGELCGLSGRTWILKTTS